MHLLLIDDHPLIHLAVRTLLLDFQPGVQVEAVLDAAAARAALARTPLPDLVLLDLELGEGNGFDLLDELRGLHPALPIAVLSSTDSMATVIRAIDQGAMAFIPKTHDPALMKEALQLVVAGGIYVPPMRMTQEAPPPPPGAPLPPPPPPLPVQPLAQSVAQLAITARQQEVLHGLLLGKPNKLIAQELGIAHDTVKDHVQAIFRALGVKSRTQAVLAVSQLR